MKTKFVDCFDRELKKDDDILYATNKEIGHTTGGYIKYKPVIVCGIIAEIKDDKLTISYQGWQGEDEIINEVSFESSGEITKLGGIYKLRD